VVWSGPDGVFGNADDLTWPTTTAADGSYVIEHLPPGTFKVTVDSSGLTGVLSTTGGDTKPLTLAPKEHRTAIDFGYGSNLPPVPVDDAATTPPGTLVRIPLLANDSDPNGNLDRATVTVASPPGHGTVVIDPVTGEATYTPETGFTGVDTFTYRVCDTGLAAAQPSQAPLCRSATVTITVPNNPPVVTGGGPTTPIVSKVKGGTLPAPLVLADSEGNKVTITEVTGLPPGLVLNPDGTWTGVLAKPGTYVLDLKLCDDGTPVLCTTQQVQIVVLSKVRLPTTGADVARMLEMAMGLVLLGAALLLVRRKVTARSHH
jgi:LPXTG-motif cell wall-anchored protein